MSPKNDIEAQKSVLSFSLICCVYNEIECLPAKLNNLLKVQEKLRICEVLVYDDGSSDGSRELLRAWSDRLTVIEGSERGGKTTGINALSKASTGDIIVLSDANVIIDESSIESLFLYFSDPTVGCASGTLSYVNANEADTAFVAAFYRDFEEHLKKLETKTGTVVYTDGTLFAIRRELLPIVPPNLTDDFFIALSVIARGFRVIAANRFIAYERASTKPSDEFKRRVRIGCNSFSCHLHMWPVIKKLGSLTVYKYLSHKFVRWISSYILLANLISVTYLAVSGLGANGTLVVLSAMIALLLLMLVFKSSSLKRAFDALGAIVATGYGVYLAVRGYRFNVWQPSQSSRKSG